MPVIGHACVGLATAVQFEPQTRRDGRPVGAIAAACWTPLVVTLSYLPDVITQIGSVAGVMHASLAGHSLIVGLVSGIVIGCVWALLSGMPAAWLVAVSVGSILGHDLLDILQAVDRAPFWPWSTRIVSIVLLPRRFFEGPVAVALFALFVVWRLRSGRTLGAFPSFIGYGPHARSKGVWAARGVVLAIVLAAVGTRGVRGQRERAAREADRMMTLGQYADALRIADTADRWPWPARPGRLDLLRGEAHEALGEAAVAERYFLQAYNEDPTNFWAVADLAEFYASRDAPVDERRRQARPYADQLRLKFPRHDRLPDVLARVDRKLAQAS